MPHATASTPAVPEATPVTANAGIRDQAAGAIRRWRGAHQSIKGYTTFDVAGSGCIH